MSNTSDYRDLLARFEGVGLTVGGDVMLDPSVWGDVRRIAPEAPVQIVKVHRRSFRLGGAANVALNAATAGLKVHLVGVVGDDTTGERVQDLARASALDDHLRAAQALSAIDAEPIARAAALVIETLRAGGKILVCGNGESAADAQHLAADLVGRYRSERRALPAIALTTDTSVLSAVGNDYGFEEIFARQVRALAARGDVVIGFSTSGNSENVVRALVAARERGARTVAFGGARGGRMTDHADVSVLVPFAETPRIREGHVTLIHALCEAVDLAYRAP